MELRTEMLATHTNTNQNADLSAYVKLAYLLIGGASLAYFLFHMHGGGTLVAAAAQASISLMYGVTALIIVFGVVIVGTSLRVRREISPARQRPPRSK
jgi:hypothetical protein